MLFSDLIVYYKSVSDNIVKLLFLLYLPKHFVSQFYQPL